MFKAIARFTPLSLHDALPIFASKAGRRVQVIRVPATFPAENVGDGHMLSGLGVPDMRGRVGTPTFYTSDPAFEPGGGDRKSTRLNSSHVEISYAVFCLKKKII